MKLDPIALDRLIELALAEDIGTGDVTTEALIPEDHRVWAYFLAKGDGVIAGLDLAGRVFARLDPTVVFHGRVADGDRVVKGTILAVLEGSTRAILSGERVALNLLQRLSGIATMARKATEVARAANPKVCVVDTRKTTPGLRSLEKYAVRCGGAKNHRFGLYDAALIKDNHIVAAGGVGPAVKAVKTAVSPFTKVEVEVQNLAQVEQALAAGAEVIMLDNMSLEEMRGAVTRIGGRATVEASGGINLDGLAEVAATGVDLISMGALTHSVKAMDISLEIGPEPGRPGPA
ncbi:MAG TPA: carboxylating nicotinate-nucleotide diphosphorylase [Bacillota bacterium]|jgi:nicotinate-nucleotide pyrophosphorylase (carboxylating)